VSGEPPTAFLARWSSYSKYGTAMQPAIFSSPARVLGALLLIGSTAAAQERSTFAVRVADAQSGSPLRGAEVFFPKEKVVYLTDSLGQARIPEIPSGEHRVRVRTLGYMASDTTIRLGGDTVTVTFRLDRSAVPVAGVTVTATEVPRALKDFEQRRKQGLGKYLTEPELARDADREFTLVASTRFPGLSMQTDTDGRPHITSTRSNCGSDAQRASADNRGVERIGGKPGMKDGLGSRGIDGEPQMTGSCSNTLPCLVRIYLDDIELGEADAGIIRTWDLSGVEYYTSNTVPPRYRLSGSACGVLLAWSKWR